jgi:hypothetical protein
MPASIRVTNVVRRAKGIYVQFDDNEELEFANRREAREFVREILNDTESKRILKALAVARALRVGADADSADDFDALIGKTLTINRNAPQNIVRIV